MQICVKTIKGKTLSLAVKPSWTINQIKIKVREMEKIPESRYSLFFQGKYLDEKKSLSDFNIKKNQTIKSII
jgi:hypothetical protein